MDVKPGYKQTEVGVIPEDWEVRALGEIAEFRTGPFGSALHKSDYTQEGVPVINPMHIINGDLKPSSSMTITEEAARLLADFRLKPGELIIGRRGDMGRCAMVKSENNGWLCGTGSMIIRMKSAAEASFIQRVLTSARAVSAIEETSVGSTMVNLNQGVLGGLKVHLPAKHEQRAIAKALSDVDALITKLDQLIAKKRDIKQAAMQQLLTGKTRLPGFSGEWEVKRLGALLKFQVGFPFSSRYFTSHTSGLRLVKNRDLKADDEVVYYDGPHLNDYVVSDGDILIGMDGDFLPCRWNKGVALLNQRVGRLYAAREVDLVFACYFLVGALKEIERATSSTTVKHLSHGDVEGIEAFLPALAEQTAIANVLSDLDAELAALEARRDKTQALKQGMMQVLLTGQVRLPVNKEPMEALA